jgi:cytochrome c oxidase subunit II
MAVSNLFWLELAISALLFLGIVAAIVYSIARFRGRSGDPDPPQTEGNRRLEVIWTVVPAVVLAIIFVLVVQTMTFVDAAAPNALEVDVIGHQWWWEFRYPDQQVVTANEPHLPVGTPVVLRLTSIDVIHSFWIPQFGWMRDAVPGKTNSMPVQLTQAGSFVGSCNQYCGVEHAWMREQVVAEPPDQFQAWLAQQAQPAAPGGSRGEQLFLQNTCVNCHTIRGIAATGNVGPDLTHVGSRSILAGGVIQNTPENMRRWIQDAQAVKPGVLMPAFRSLSDADVNDLAAYLEGLR